MFRFGPNEFVDVGSCCLTACSLRWAELELVVGCDLGCWIGVVVATLDVPNAEKSGLHLEAKSTFHTLSALQPRLWGKLRHGMIMD